MLLPCVIKTQKNPIDSVYAKTVNGKNVRGTLKEFVTNDEQYY